MKFADIPGLYKTKELLKQSVHSGHIAHAHLFAGAPGCVALPMALAWITYLHCQNRGEDACGTCAACVKSLKYIHPDTHFAFPAPSPKSGEEEKTRIENLKSWRAFLLEHPFGMPEDWISFLNSEDKQLSISREGGRQIIQALTLKPFESAYKVMLIWCPERMHPSAANALLKILEEPSPQTVFILVSYAADSLLPTILSRVQHVHISLLSDDELKGYLQSIDSKANLEEIVRLANGNINLALRLLNQEENTFFPTLTQWLRACYKRDYGQLVQMAEDFHAFERMNQHLLLRYGLSVLRESAIALSGAESLHRVRDQELEFVRNFSGVLSIPVIEKAVNLLNRADYHIERNGSAKMIFLDLSVALGELFKIKPQS